MDLISNIRTAIKEQRLKTELQNIIRQLSILGYEYDFDTFPPLENTDKFDTDIEGSPKSLAEALLWKLGKWKTYSNFVAYYQDNNSESSDTDVVFHAFARHLKEDKPIFDQHTLRSMWIVDDKLSDDDRSHCKKYLMNSKGNWKQSGSGGSGTKCYALYVRFVEELVSNNSGLTNENIDRLFMPLGQALKKNTQNYEQVKGYLADQSSTER